MSDDDSIGGLGALDFTPGTDGFHTPGSGGSGMTPGGGGPTHPPTEVTVNRQDLLDLRRRIRSLEQSDKVSDILEKLSSKTSVGSTATSASKEADIFLKAENESAPKLGSSSLLDIVLFLNRFGTEMRNTSFQELSVSRICKHLLKKSGADSLIVLASQLDRYFDQNNLVAESLQAVNPHSGSFESVMEMVCRAIFYQYGYTESNIISGVHGLLKVRRVRNESVSKYIDRFIIIASQYSVSLTNRFYVCENLKNPLLIKSSRLVMDELVAGVSLYRHQIDAAKLGNESTFMVCEFLRHQYGSELTLNDFAPPVKRVHLTEKFQGEEGGRGNFTDNRECFFCNKSGHISGKCPERKRLIEEGVVKDDEKTSLRKLRREGRIPASS